MTGMFAHGETVLYRELWRDAVMTAIPMRVVSDSAARTVLYLAADTPFQAARTYVNFQEPLRRTPIGFDTVDLVLDLVVSPDGGCRRKDEEDFARAVAAGQIPPETAEVVLADAVHMEAVAAAAGAPFDEDWRSWRPPVRWL
jgi:hypothetical protein